MCREQKDNRHGEMERVRAEAGEGNLLSRGRKKEESVGTVGISMIQWGTGKDTGLHTNA